METKLKTILILGIFGVIFPFLGIPIGIKVYVLSGLALVSTLIAFSLLPTRQLSEGQIEKPERIKQIDDRIHITAEYGQGTSGYTERDSN